MFPIRDHNPSGRTPYVVYTLMAANILMFLANLPISNDPRALWAFYADYAVIPARVTQGLGYETLVTSMFLHAGFMHLAGNMLFLYIFGDNLEDRMGHVPFLLFYVASGIGAALIQVMTEPFSTVPMVGASGAIAGVMGGYLLLFPRAQVDILLILIIFIRVFPIPAWIMLGLWFGMQFIGGAGADPEAGGVAYWAHAGGFAIGLVLTVPLWLRLGGAAFWSRTHGHPPHPEAEYRLSPSRIPRVQNRRSPKPRSPWK
ncbi:MAG: rhomboid family intramembrane serine protease [Pseudomonadota bacterium]